MQKLKGIWPLQGGSKGYVNTLKILEKVNGGLSEEELEAWMRTTFNLTGEKAIGGCIRVVHACMEASILYLIVSELLNQNPPR